VSGSVTGTLIAGVALVMAWRIMSRVANNGTVRYQNCPNASAWTGYPQKIAIGSRSISVRRSSMCGDGSSWS